MLPVRYKLGFYIPEDAILHSHYREKLKYYEYNEIQNYCSNAKQGIVNM
jgi:hypothetical protein